MLCVDRGSAWSGDGQACEPGWTIVDCWSGWSSAWVALPARFASIMQVPAQTRTPPCPGGFLHNRADAVGLANTASLEPDATQKGRRQVRDRWHDPDTTEGRTIQAPHIGEHHIGRPRSAATAMVVLYGDPPPTAMRLRGTSAETMDRGHPSSPKANWWKGSPSVGPRAPRMRNCSLPIRPAARWLPSVLPPALVL